MTEPKVFNPEWPEGLEQGTFYRVLCDDKGRDEGTWLQVAVANDGDIHVSMQDWEHITEPETRPSPLPTLRSRRNHDRPALRGRRRGLTTKGTK